MSWNIIWFSVIDFLITNGRLGVGKIGTFNQALLIVVLWDRRYTFVKTSKSYKVDSWL